MVSYKSKSVTHQDLSLPKIKNYSKTATSFGFKTEETYTNPIDTTIRKNEASKIWSFDRFNVNKEKHRSSSNRALIVNRNNYNPILGKYHKNVFFDNIGKIR